MLLTPKRRRLTNYFAKLPSNTGAQEFPDLQHGRLPLHVCHCHCRSRAGRQKILRHAAPTLPCRRIAVLTRREDIWRALERAIALRLRITCYVSNYSALRISCSNFSILFLIISAKHKYNYFFAEFLETIRYYHLPFFYSSSINIYILFLIIKKKSNLFTSM